MLDNRNFYGYNRKRKYEQELTSMEELKYCKYCGARIPADAVVCTACGRQVENIAKADAPFIINNVASSAASSAAPAAPSRGVRLVKKWVAFCLCLFLGFLGAHKFYEGKIGTGILYLFIFGIFCIGWLIDIFNILGKSDPYTV